MIDTFLARFHLTISDIKYWIVHSGGSKVNESVLVSFTYLLEELNEKQTYRGDDLGVFLTMDPGTAFECALFII